MSASEVPYFMEDAREAERLTAKVNPDQWVHEYFEPYLKSARTVLDVGCGPAAILCQIAKTYGDTRVVGIDASATRIAAARTRLEGVSNASVELARANRLPFADGAFDFVYSRFLLEYLADRKLAVDEMTRVCQHGGHVLLQDLDGQLVWHYPIDEVLQSNIERVMTELAKTGFDPHVGRKLFSLAHQAGLRNVSVKIDAYHLYPGRIDDKNLALWETKLDIAMPAICEALGGVSEGRSMRARYLEYLQRDDTMSYSVVFTVVGRKSE